MRQVQIRFRADAGHLRRSRRWVVEEAARRGATPATQRVLELLTSEVVTNAVKYGPPGGEVVVSVQRVEDDVLVVVRDECPDPPVVRRASARRAGGHGVRLVDQLSREWGVHRHPSDGKSVWFRLPLRPVPTSVPA
ncbi:ATP-binding protein [Actinotalea subterranea]|uniref:ATP-binding protein n=1 Tax=Actinotalea subterranea TaxID=2607497 RepID=UPI0011EBE1B1|nr:ATP-binding protein [Actinotalea subterranea]